MSKHYIITFIFSWVVLIGVRGYASTINLVLNPIETDSSKIKETIAAVKPMQVLKKRAFPSLDKKTNEGKDFKVSFVNNQPEFNPSFIAANFGKNPKVDTLISKAKEAFKAVKELGNFVEVITGNELLELPVGLKKKDPTSDNEVELAITEVKFHPKYAEFKAWAKVIIPVKGPNGEPSRELFFGAEGIKLSHDGAIIGDMKLVLLGNQPIPINGDNWLLTLKGGIDLKTGAFAEQSYAEFDCSGLKEIGLEGDLRVSRNVLLPITNGGNYKCGTSTDNQFVKDGSEINNDCYVGASFSVQAKGWNDMLLEVTLPKFEVVGLKGWGFHLNKAVLDLSDTRNSDDLKLPAGYAKLYPKEQRNLWRGFYARKLWVILPEGIEDKKTADKRVKFGAENLIIDSQGVSGTFFAEDVLKIGDGSAGKWAFTIEDVSLTLNRNALEGGSIAGGIAVPILEKPMDYKGYIHTDGYGLEVGLKSQYKAPVFLGEMTLNKNSNVAIHVKEGKVYPYANLSGELSIAGKINQEAGEEEAENATEEDNKGFNFQGIVFEELELQTEPGTKPIQAKSFGFEGEMNLMNFPVSISDVKLVTPNNQVGLSFNLKVHLDKDGSYAETGMAVLGTIEEGAAAQDWKFDRVKMESLKIDYQKSNLHLKGELEVLEDDPVYGDAFGGELEATFSSLNFTASGKAIFGAKDFRYWFVDIWSKSKGNGSSKLLINSFAGGVSYRMRKVSGGLSLDGSKAMYKPDENADLGVRAGVEISTQNSDSFNGKAYLEMEFNNHGGLNRIGFMGEGAMMGDNTKGSIEEHGFGALEKTFDKVNKYLEKNQKQVKKMMDGSNFLAVAQEAIPVSDVASSGKVGVYIGIEKDFVNNTFDGEFELYMDLEGVKGGGENNLAGYAKIHTSPDDWYIYIGTPQKRIELLFQVGVQLRVGGYFMTGTKLPNQLDPHPIVVKILGDDMLNGNRQSNQLEAGKGFAFGMNFGYGYSFNYAIFYAFLEVGAGFDVMHAYYPDAKCKGRPGPVGNDGWYSMGQIYAYLYGEFGVEVDLAFIKGKFPIVEAGVAAMLRGQFPNPVYIKGYVGMYYKILGGLVSGRMRMKVEIGEECELENISKDVGVPIISDVSPQDKSDEVSVFTAPQVVFNYPADKDFSLEMDEGTRVFKLQLKQFSLYSEGKELEGELEWNDTKDAVLFKPLETLPSQKEVKVTVEVSFDEKIDGTYHTLEEDGKAVVEKREITFKTAIAPDYIPWENIAYSYPLPEQRSFHPKEYKQGYVKMITPQHYLFDGDYVLKAEFTPSNGGEGYRTSLTYDRSKGMVFYEIPDIILDTEYQLHLKVFPPGSNVPSQIVTQETEVYTDTEEGSTAWYNPNGDQQKDKNTSSSVVVANKKASNVVLSGGTEKSILDYTFKTSEYATFKNKVKDLSVTNHITNFIYADVHSLSIEVAAYEYLDKMEILGSKYSQSRPLISAEAVLNDSYYKSKIYPLLYEDYPLDGDIHVNREEEFLGIPPIRSFYVGNQYIANVEGNSDSHLVKNRVPFIYNLPLAYKQDMLYLRSAIVNRYVSDATATNYEKYKYLIGASFPAMPLGKYNAKLIYTTPGKVYAKSYSIQFRND